MIDHPKHTARLLAVLWCGLLALAATSFPALADPAADPGRLFFTPAQRAQLEAARLRAPRGAPHTQATADDARPPVRYDGLVIRSDGKTIRWVDGRPQLDSAAVAGLKPGQVRADDRVYEPYQIVRQPPPAPGTKDAQP